MIMELRRRGGMTWDELASMFGVDRHTILSWASGRPLSEATALHVEGVLAVLRLVDRGDPAVTRAWLHSPDARGLLPDDLLREGRFHEVVTPVPSPPQPRPPPLSAAARAARQPPPPATLLRANWDRIHVPAAEVIASIPLKVSKSK